MRVKRRTMLQGAMAGMATMSTSSALFAREAKQPLAGDIPIPPPITTAERLDRLDRARERMAKNGIGAILVEAGASLDYYTGVRWWRSERLTGAIIPVEGDPVIVTPFFEKPSVEESLAIPARVLTWHEHVEPLSLVAEFLRHRGLEKEPVGIEESTRFFIVDKLREALPGARIVSANPVVRAGRMIKTKPELDLMQAASDITLAAIAEVHDALKPGMTDGEVKALLSAAMVKRGGASPWALVLFGPAAALPHGTGRPQTLEKGQVVLIDTGCSVHGYQADISRTFVVGAAPSADQRRVFDQVARGQEIAREACIPGNPAGSVDDAVRSAYESWGYGPGYALPGLSHRTGHGIGMEGHEPINLVRGEETPLAPGMCFSNEPGIYLPGRFGVRLEDCFTMTEEGPRWFSVPPKSIDDPIGSSARLA
ncbi:M24 family metallopeptidase [Sphingomicrobium lutaoense]|uniref:Xaa-Pro dipeptidase n=1 Tax=Sphingomicrobium lutaoense TaxID=515949 RepID=A0A839Z215_9SPHN|nr:Xaa-Pro peptidase family protein [Sphingomicrobium lutaoense]MBB3763635.1 Xaa-Pro dipeptidase [Sphingomicrobium lutaoense]